MKKETLRVTWKYIRRAGYGRTPMSYARYIASNDRHEHSLKVRDGSELFELLKNNRVFKDKEQANFSILLDGVYNDNDQLMYVTNFRRV